MGTIESIQAAAKKRVLVQIMYKDAKGGVTQRMTEPYEIKGDSYFGYDVNKQAIRNFKLNGIVDAKVTGTPYIAKWPVTI